ncbi:MAG: proton-conducting transporter membrane subunit, partial [Bacteroidales bacterium]
MADIAFLLLIFFLVTTTMDVDSGIIRMLPPPIDPNAPPPPPVNERNVFVVLVDAQDRLLVEGQQGSIESGVIVLSAGMFSLTDTPFNILEINEAAFAGELSSATIVTGMLLIFLGCISKSGQMPLHVWLPDAMAGPTPVSALIHAATMVTAGVFLLARLFPVVSQSATVMAVIAIVGLITLFFGGLLALVQDDLKKILAYSTVSQLG